MSTPLRPLVGLRVLDLSRYLPGPFLTQILVDLGAEVIKIEAPQGDSLRWVPPFVDGPAGPMGAAFAAVNAGKRSLAVDSRKPAGQALLRALAATADVLVESFRPGVIARMGLDLGALRAAHPRLITASISGYGQQGPHALRAGHDLNYLARAGLLGLWGPADRPPQVPAAQLADVAGGALPAAIGILAALMERNQTGMGRHLDISMTRGVMALGAVGLAQAAAGDESPRGAGFLTGGAPCYRCYATADGRFLALGALEPAFFGAFCAGLGLPALAGAAFDTGPEGEAAAAQIAEALAAAPLDHWLAHFAGQDVALDPVLSPAEALAEAGWLAEGGAPLQIHLDLGCGRPADGAAAPALSADRDALLASLDPDLVSAALAAGALPSPASASSSWSTP